MEIKPVENIETNVNVYMNKPFVSSGGKEHHDSQNGFKGTLDESIKEIKEKDEKSDKVLSSRDIELMELRGSRIRLNQLKNNVGEEDKMSNYIILHGSFGSKDGNWFPWLKEILENNKCQVEVPQMPVGVGIQNYDSWSKELDKLSINENTIIIAHSIAPVFVCKYLINKQIHVKKLVFVCGFNNYLDIDPDFDAVNESMFTDNLADIKEFCSNIVCFYSDNDPYVKFDVEKEFADTIATEQHIVSGGGHINAETGYTKFEEIINYLDIKAQKKI